MGCPKVHKGRFSTPLERVWKGGGKKKSTWTQTQRSVCDGKNVDRKLKSESLGFWSEGGTHPQ